MSLLAEPDKTIELLIRIRDTCDYVSLAILLLFEAFIFWRLKLQVDRSGLITLAIYTFIIILRSLDNIITSNSYFVLLFSVN